MVGSRNGHGAQKSEQHAETSPGVQCAGQRVTLGFKLETMADLVRSGFATVRVETVKELGFEIEFACVRITDAGWRSLEGLTSRRRSPRPPEDR